MKRLAILFVVLAACLQIKAQNNSLYINNAGNVGIGAPNPATTLDVQADATEGGLQTGQFYITGNANPDQRLVLGYDTTNNFGFIEAGIAGGAVENLALVPHGGNVGIGTTTPGSPLTIVSNGGNALTMLGSSTNSIGLLIANTASSGGSFSIYSSGGGPAAAGSFGIYDNNAATSRLVIAPNGKVGIGTTGPGYPLEVKGSGTANIGLTTSTGHTFFQTTPASGANTYYDNLTVGSETLFRTSNSLSADTCALNILANGSVGIGTTTPGATLDVNGTVRAVNYIATTSGTKYADFVFKPGYKLPPLSAVEASIKKEGHLPGIPSEAEAKAHGIDLAEMQVKLLQKIEELTLHQIEQEKRLDNQARRIEQLEKENADLKRDR